MDVHIVLPEKVLGKCAWCRKRVSKGKPVYGLGAKARKNVDLSEYEGSAIEITIVTQDKLVPMIVAGADSEAKRDGKDFLFMACSMKCAREMKEALQDEISLSDMFEGIQEL